MVRRIRHCSSCQRRFISKSRTDLYCSQCDIATPRVHLCSTSASSSAGTLIDDRRHVDSTNQTASIPPAASTSTTEETRRPPDEQQHPLKRARTETTEAPLPLPASSTTSSSRQSYEDITTSTAKVTPNDLSYRGEVAIAAETHHDDMASSLSLSLLPANNNTSKGNNLQIVEICDDSSENSGRSEGLDDFHCTQIYDDDDNDDEISSHNSGNSNSNNQGEMMDAALGDTTDNATMERHDDGKEKSTKVGALNKDTDELTENNANGNERSPTVSKVAAAALATNNMESENICFICGSSLARITSGLKGRLNHIKRCAKKHGVTAKDIRLNDDDDAFHNNHTMTTTAAAPNKSIAAEDKDKKPAAVSNPYAKAKPKPLEVRLQWHRDAADDLKLADATSATTLAVNSGKEAAPGETKQSALTNFFKAPMRSLNNVLLSNAKRVAKTADLNAQPRTASSSSKQQGGTQGGQAKGRWGGWGVRRPGRSCPLYKRIPGTDFICDGFTYAGPSLTKNYWLTHFHSDHYGGIDRSWNCGTIYCSKVTANLVHDRLGVEMEFLHPLGLNTPYVVESNGRPITVTLLDANHCPGAVMFLFHVGKRSILHVGDFRWNREKMLSSAPLKALSMKEPKQLDDLFLDTTYCNERYTLPSQEVAIKAAIECAVREVEQAKRNREKLLMLFGAYTIGKERIYLSVAERLGVKVYVNSQRFRVLSALEWPKERLDMLTTKRDESTLWVVELGHINMKKLPPYLYGLSKAKNPVRKFDRVVGFRPTGWSNRPGNSIISTATSGKLTVHSVPYSEHSSFPELLDCIRVLKPKKIIPTVNASKSQQQVELLLRHVNIKQSVLDF